MWRNKTHVNDTNKKKHPTKSSYTEKFMTLNITKENESLGELNGSC